MNHPGQTRINFNRVYGTWHSYSYVMNAPTSLTDPSGFEAQVETNCVLCIHWFGGGGSTPGGDPNLLGPKPDGILVFDPSSYSIVGGPFQNEISQTINHSQLPSDVRVSVDELLGNAQFRAAYNDALAQIDSELTQMLRIVGLKVDKSYLQPVAATIERRSAWWGLRNPYHVTEVGTYVLDGKTRHGTGTWQPLKSSAQPVAIIAKYPSADTTQWLPNDGATKELSKQFGDIPIFTHSPIGRLLYIGDYGPVPFVR